MTPHQILSDLKKVVDAATEGPWNVNISDRNDTYMFSSKPDNCLLSDAPYDETLVNLSQDDFIFIAQSRTVMPRLIAALEVALSCLNEHETDVTMGAMQCMNSARRAKLEITKLLSGEK